MKVRGSTRQCICRWSIELNGGMWNPYRRRLCGSAGEPEAPPSSSSPPLTAVRSEVVVDVKCVGAGGCRPPDDGETA